MPSDSIDRADELFAIPMNDRVLLLSNDVDRLTLSAGPQKALITRVKAAHESF